MHILPQPLSSNEKKLFNEIIDLMIVSNTTNGEKGRPEFDEFLEDYGDEYGVNKVDILFAIAEDIIHLEEIGEDPDKMVEMNELELMMAKFALLSIIPEKRLPDAKASLLIKLDNLIKLKEHDKNQN